VLIVCHNTAARDTTWPKQILEWEDRKQAIPWQLVCYNSLYKIKGRKLVVILDEAHKLTAKQWPFFLNNEILSVIILTATPPRDYEKMQMIMRLAGRNSFEYPADQGIEEGVLNDYRIYQYNVQLDNTEKYLTSGKGQLMTEWEQYVDLCATRAMYERHQNYKMYEAMGGQIMRYLGTTKTKMLAAQYVMDRLKKNNRRFIVFCASIEQANEISPYVYHSETDDTYFKLFCGGEIDHLACVDQIQEGANIPNLTHAISIQVDSNPGNLIQQIGRLLRMPVGTTSVMFLITADRTFDTKWTLKALAKTPKEKIKTEVLKRELYWPK
jgi:superfamily II DNA or RNA helicase